MKRIARHTLANPNMVKVKKHKPELTPEQLIKKQLKDEEDLKRKEAENYRRNMLSRVLTGTNLAEKIEAIREFNPYFYLLAPKPKKEKRNETTEIK